MGRKSGKAKVINGRPNQGFIPLNPYGTLTNSISPAKKTVMRVLGIIAVLLLVVLVVMASGGGTSLHVYWSLIAPVLAAVPVLLLCVILLLYLRGRTKTTWSRLGATCVMLVVISIAAAAGFTFVYLGLTYGEMPVAYATSPLGQRIVIMKSINPDIAPDAMGNGTTQYSGYEMANSQFYLYPSTVPGTAIFSDIERKPKWEIEWLENDDARLYLPDYEGYPHSETRIITFDLKNMQESLAEKGYLLSVTPAPATVTPQEPQKTEAPDPFAY